MYWTHLAPSEEHTGSSSQEALATCNICSEPPGKFGLLEHCSHIFCLECIRLWRSQREQQDRTNLRKCPVCRVDSFLILPASSLLTGDAKIQALSTYKQALGKIPCKLLSGCPFGDSCLYRHDQMHPVPLPTVLRGADRRKHKTSGVTLSDFFPS
jgi:E3 ubiquitin-protein ligase makorin